jgi:hypothetical protein
VDQPAKRTNTTTRQITHTHSPAVLSVACSALQLRATRTAQALARLIFSWRTQQFGTFSCPVFNVHYAAIYAKQIIFEEKKKDLMTSKF